MIAFLAIVAATVVGAAFYLGFLPGSRIAGASADSVAGDGALADAADGDTAGVVSYDSAALRTPDSIDGAPTPVTFAGTVTAADSAAGDIVYHGAGRCVGCHGNVGEGAPGLGPSLRDSVLRADDRSPAFIARIVAGGSPPTAAFRVAMPAYAGQLATADIEHVAAYVFALAHPGATVADTGGTLPRP